MSPIVASSYLIVAGILFGCSKFAVAPSAELAGMEHSGGLGMPELGTE